MIFTYDETDEVVFSALKEFNKKNIVSAENYLVKSEDVKSDMTNKDGKYSIGLYNRTLLESNYKHHSDKCHRRQCVSYVQACKLNSTGVRFSHINQASDFSGFSHPF